MTDVGGGDDLVGSNILLLMENIGDSNAVSDWHE